ncbi:hypothetical protein [Phyllobacterium sp. K27]
MIVFTHDIQNRIAKGFRVTPVARAEAGRASSTQAHPHRHDRKQQAGGAYGFG